ncbi:MAG: 1-(5-phosphoribosyl)-5-[(5-phosphoribosylamino)methylideneamino]imidazole-4-carboxamide isomerase [Deltaproteobacteria bacterium]|nr:MAG: 1-(5-phosphoribosyl)-5-[(5-phosphoribosylamino)methylideneamino]imidazole-4-carboxamide isomerase [Deltaproteobacteria bacterium]
MLVIPAIDLKDGRCVRLVRGDMTQATVYADDPVAVARGFEAAGAEWIHVVDLDGAIRGAPVNADAIGAVCRAVDARVEVGGGVRDLDTLERVFAAGAGRVVLGTAALEDPDLFGEACRRHPGAILAGIDARAGKVAVAGWVRDSATEATALAARVADAGAAGIVFTDIARDGTGSGVNAAAVDALAARVTLPVIASGGVASLDDVRALRALGRANLTAVIVGRALYTGAVDLAAALRVGRGEDASGNRRGDG